MTTTEIQEEVRSYLCGPRDFDEGAALYRRYGINLRLRQYFAVERTETARDMLMNELRAIAGLTEAEFNGLPRLAEGTHIDTELIIEVDLTPTQHDDGQVYEPIHIDMERLERFRDKYRFLNDPDCPDILKVLVSDMFTAHGTYKEAHARLQTATDEESAALCESVVESYLANREIREELDHYRDHGTILGRAAKFRLMEQEEDFTSMPGEKLMASYASAQTQTSKQRRKVADLKAAGRDAAKAEIQLEYWTAQRDRLKGEINRRKEA